MDYSHFEVEDFISDEFFIRWVLDSDAEAAAFWEAYRLEDREMQDKICQARSLLLNIRKAEQSAVAPLNAQKIWGDIHATILARSSEKRLSLLRIAAVVSIFVFLLLAWILIKPGFVSAPNLIFNETLDIEDGFHAEVNASGKTIDIRLSDGSVVNLENNSRLIYYKDHTNLASRRVYLKGEAFFKVAKNTRQPFYVYTHEVVTKVIGTSFRVKAYDDENNIVVSVKEGKVSVNSENKADKQRDVIESEVKGVVLLPNQQVLYKRESDSFNKTLVETPEIINNSALRNNFDFENTPVKNVFRVLEEAYGVEFIFNEEVLQECYVTVPLGDEPLFQKLQIICRTIGARYESIDGTIVISSKGCLK